MLYEARGTNDKKESPYDAFLSYSRRDIEIARRLQEALEARKLSIFRDETGILLGELWPVRLEQAIAGSRAFLFLISQESVSSGWVEEERTYAQIRARRESDLKLIPVVLDNVEPPGFMSGRQGVALREEDDFEHAVEALTEALGGTERAVRPEVAIPPEIAFLAFFREGLLDPIYDWLVARRNASSAAHAAVDQGVIRTLESRGIGLTGLASQYVGPAYEAIKQPARMAGELLELLEAYLEEQDVFGSVIGLGWGRALLLRDLLALAELLPDGEEEQERRERVAELARLFLPLILAEGELRLGLEVSQRMRGIFPPTSRDQLLYAGMLLRLGSAEEALNLLEVYRGEDFFGSLGLSPEERVEAIQDWAAAAKAAGVARSMHGELVRGYAQALQLADESAQGHEPDHRRRKADLLQNRATQLGVFGDEDEWVTAQADLDEACRLYEELGATNSLIAARANLVALTLDRLAEGKPPEHLADQLAPLQDAADAASASHDLFFFLYQKARLLRRLGRDSDSRACYEQAARVAHQCGLEHRAAIARLWVWRLDWQARRLPPERFLSQVEREVDVLELHEGDPWAINALVQALMDDLVELYYTRSEKRKAVDAAVRAFRAAATSPRSSARRLARILSRLGNLDADGAVRDQFVEDHAEILGQRLGIPRWQVTWEAIEKWISRQEEH